MRFIFLLIFSVPLSVLRNVTYQFLRLLVCCVSSFCEDKYASVLALHFQYSKTVWQGKRNLLSNRMC